MSTETKPDSEFQRFILTFHKHFGIEKAEDVQPEKREILPESIRIDALVIFPEGFDFSKLHDRLFPFLGIYDIFEYKGLNDRLMGAHFYQYSFTELGLITARYLAKKRTDRGWKELSLLAARKRTEELRANGALHSCCTVILSTGDPKQLRKEVGFEAVSDYTHLDGALYRLIISENGLIGSIATYLVVLNDLPVCAKNAPLLLLTTGKKKKAFCKWLLSDNAEATLQKKLFYQVYLLEHHLIQDEELALEMKHNVFGPPDHNWMFDYLDERPAEERERFLELTLKRMLHVDSRQEAIQRLLGADSPVEVAFKVLSTEEQRREFLERLEQTS